MADRHHHAIGLQIAVVVEVEPDDAAWDARRPWLVRHPLQPFDARYFDGRDPALFSYSRAFAAMREGGFCALSERRVGKDGMAVCLPLTWPK